MALAPHQLLYQFFPLWFPSSLWLRFCLSCALQETNPSIRPAHPPVRGSIPTRRRLDPRSHVAFRPEGRRHRGRRVARTEDRTRAPLRRRLRRLSLGECVSCRGRPRHLSSLFFVFSFSRARSVASAAVLQQCLLHTSCRPSPEDQAFRPSKKSIIPRRQSDPLGYSIDLIQLSLRCRLPSILASKRSREDAVKDARNQQALKRRSHLSCSPRSEEGNTRALLVTLR